MPTKAIHIATIIRLLSQWLIVNPTHSDSLKGFSPMLTHLKSNWFHVGSKKSFHTIYMPYNTKSRYKNPQKLTEFSPRSHLAGKRQHKKTQSRISPATGRWTAISIRPLFVNIWYRTAIKQLLETYFSSTISTGWERTVHVSRCLALYSGRIFVPLCRELIILVF